MTLLTTLDARRATVLLVCTRCNRTGTETERNGERAGAAFLKAVRQAPQGETVRVQAIACMSGCQRSCVIGLMAPGKVGYLFGDLPPTAAAAAAVSSLASAYAASPDGMLARQTRPPLLRAGILARLPPLDWVSHAEITWPAPPSPLA